MNVKNEIVSLSIVFMITVGLFGWQKTEAGVIEVINSGFEDVSGQSEFFEFTFGTPVGWDLHDPNGVVSNPGTFPGTLEPNGVEFFNTTAPEGSKVAILFNSGSEGDGEYGFIQTLPETLQANASYTLEVEVGNITSGTSQNGTFFDLSEFPGYRVELLAGGVVVAQDNNSLNIPEGEFFTSTVFLDVGETHDQLGENLAIRLVNLNIIPDGFTQETSPDLEVDFDNVVLTVSVPEPSSIFLFILFGAGMIIRRGVRS